MKIRNKLLLLISSALLTLSSGCATMDVTARKALEPTVDNQQVVLAVQTAKYTRPDSVDTYKGDKIIEVDDAVERLFDTLDSTEGSVIKDASGKLFKSVVLLPKGSESMPQKEIRSVHGADYILTLGIGYINVNHKLNRNWFYSLPMVFFKMYAPIVTFKPQIVLDIKVSNAATGAVLLQKQVVETSTNHFAPKDPGPEVRKLISLTINNALVSILQDTQKSIATAVKNK